MILPETDFQRRQGDFTLLKACRRASPPAVPLLSVPSVLCHALRAAPGAALPGDGHLRNAGVHCSDDPGGSATSY